MAGGRRQLHPLSRRVGRRIRRLRKEQDFDWDAFVEETGLNRGHVSQVERGLVAPTLRTLSKIARALDVTVADLVLGDTERERLFERTALLSRADVRRLLAEAERLADEES